MSLFERMKLENSQMNVFDYHKDTCFSCQYWIHKIRKDSKFCHKCVNNLSLSIKKETRGYNLDGLRDYHKPSLPENPNSILCKKENPGNS